MKRSWVLFLAASVLLVLGFLNTAQAGTIWANSAGSDLSKFDSLTGLQQAQYFPSGGNGRGVVQVGNTLYITYANSGIVYTKDATTGADTGAAFTIAGASGLSAIAYDGTNFWVGDYSGTNHAFLYTPTGTLLKTISLVNSEGYSDGIEYFNGNLIVNRYDGGFARAGGNQYDIYDTNGNLLVSDFIDTNGHGNGTGIAFDGTNFWVSDIFNNQLSEWNGTTGAFIGDLVLQGNHTEIEDLSVDYAARTDTGGGQVPEPATLLLFGAGLFGTGLLRKKFKK